MGSVNTVVRRPDGSLYGHNTDIGGFIALAKRAGVEIAGKKAAILGSGGTSLTAQAACRRLGAREIVVVSRKGPVDYDALYRDHADAEVLVNTTPVGMYPNNGESAADISRLPGLTGVLDVIYNPDKTALILDAEARGIPCAGGLYMLVGQAREAAELFTGRAIPESETERIYALLRGEALNLILVGMPGSGKSSVGTALAGAWAGRSWTATRRSCAAAGKSIPEIFAQDGEAAFRALEARVICDVCREKGAGHRHRRRRGAAGGQRARHAAERRGAAAEAGPGRAAHGRQAPVQSPGRRWRTCGAREPMYRAAADATASTTTPPGRTPSRGKGGVL